MKFDLKIFLASLAACILSSCVSVDDDVAQNPGTYWKAPKEALPAEEIEPEQIKTDEIVEKSKVVSASEKMENGEPLTLTDLLDIALENNTSTRQYWFQAKVYAVNKGKALAEYYPTLSLTADVHRAKTRNAGIGGTPTVGSYYETGYGPGLQLSWMLYDFGKREALVGQAKEQLIAANFDFNQALQDVALQVNMAYYGLYEAMGAVKASMSTLEDAQTTYKSAKTRFDEGVGNKQDMLMALASLKNAEYAVEKDTAFVQQQRANLAKVLGIRVSEKLKIWDDIVLPVSEEAKKQIETILADALKNRQDILAAYANMRAYENLEEAAKRSFLPTISAYGNATWTEYSRDVAGNPSYRYAIGLGLSWDLFDAFTRQYEVIGANAMKRAQAQKLKESEISVISDVWTYYHAYISSLKQVESTAAAVEANQQAFDAVKVGYDNGVNSLTDFLTAQSNLAVARQQDVTAKAYLSMSVAQLAHATGALLLLN